ncbi:MAG: hypothetical protein KDJ29_02765 [Hyphomicrobiales bacterium]|nr:hypothetical protein [Hyphomicrobiales bacterium]
MRIYTNTRTWRARMLLWLFLAAFVATIITGVYSMAIGNVAGQILSAILAVFFLLSAAGMEFYCRRYVCTIDIANGDMIITTRGLLSSFRTSGIGEIGKQIDSRTISTDQALRLAQLTDSLRPLQMAAIDNQFHFLKAGAQQRRYILDVTADPEAAARIEQALTQMRAQ